MKLKTGFVSNSSTSSFIVFVDNKIASRVKAGDKLVLKLQLGDESLFQADVGSLFNIFLTNEAELNEYASSRADTLTYREVVEMRTAIKNGKSVVMGTHDSEVTDQSFTREMSLYDMLWLVGHVHSCKRLS